MLRSQLIKRGPRTKGLQRQRAAAAQEAQGCDLIDILNFARRFEIVELDIDAIHDGADLRAVAAQKLH